MRLHCALILVLLAALATANDGAWAESGSPAGYTKHEQVQMVSENVTLEVHDDFTWVSAEFVFRNHGSAETVTMAFPDEGYNYDQGIETFASWVDGERTKVTKKALEVSEEDVDSYKAVWLKEVAFGQGQTRRVKVRYKVINGSGVYNTRSVNYIFETGKTWRGPIENATITVDWRNVKKHSKPEFGFYTNGDTDAFRDPTVQWSAPAARVRKASFKSFAADFNLYLSMMDGFWSVSINGIKVPHEAAFLEGPPIWSGKPQDLLVRVVQIPALFGGWVKTDGGTDWTPFAHPALGPLREFEVKGGGVTFLGKTVRLRRGNIAKDEENWVYLKDLVEALGGTYKYDSKAEHLDILIPKR